MCVCYKNGNQPPGPLLAMARAHLCLLASGSSRDRSRSGADEITSRVIKMHVSRQASITLSIRVLRVSVAESDVYTDVALAIRLAATGSHHHIA